MLASTSKYRVLYKAIALAMVCLFLINDIAWAQPADYFTSKNSTLAPELRFKPFSKVHGLDFRNTLTAAYTAREIRDQAVDGNFREGPVIAFNKKRFPNGEIKIHQKIETGSLRSGKKYALAVFEFTEEKKQIQVLFLKDYANLTVGDREELKKFGIKNDADISHLSCPGLEGVWFINPAAGPAAEQARSNVSRNDASPTSSSGVVRDTNVLVLDDDPALLDATADSLRSPLVKRIEKTGTIEDGLAILRKNPDINFLVLDFKLGEELNNNGVEFCRLAFTECGFKGNVVIYSAVDTPIINKLRLYPDLWTKYQNGRISIQLKQDMRAFELIRARVEEFARGEEGRVAGKAAPHLMTIDEDIPLAPMRRTPEEIGVTPETVSRFRDYHIVIADDKPYIRNAIESTVAGCFSNIYKTGTVEEAVDTIKRLRAKGIPDNKIVILSDYEFGTEQTNMRRKDGRDLLNILRLHPSADYTGEKLDFKGHFFFISGSVISKDQIPGYDRTQKDLANGIKITYGIDYMEKNTDKDFPVTLLRLIYSRLTRPYDLTKPIITPMPVRPMSKPADISFLNGGVNDCETMMKLGLRALVDSLKEIAQTASDKKTCGNIGEYLIKMADFFDFGNVDRNLPFNSRAHNYKGRLFYAASYLVPKVEREIAPLPDEERKKFSRFITLLDNLSLTMQISSNYMLRLLRLSAAVGNTEMPIRFDEFKEATIGSFIKDYKDNITVDLVCDEGALEGMELPYALTFVVSYILDNALEQYIHQFGRGFRGNICVKIDKEKKSLEISVTDEAGGIPEDIIPNIFLRKFTTKPGGAGFGLFWAKKLMEIFGGSISVVNVQTKESRKGARFSLSLPLDWKNIVKEKKATPEELVMKVFHILTERRHPDADECTEPIAHEIYMYSAKMAELTKMREVLTSGRKIHEKGSDYPKLEIELEMPKFRQIGGHNDLGWYELILEKGTTQEDIQNLFLTLLTRDNKKLVREKNLPTTYLSSRQAVILPFNYHPKILLRSHENMLKEKDGITLEMRREYQRILRQIGYSIHKLGGETWLSKSYISSIEGLTEEKKEELIAAIYGQIPLDVFMMIHRYTDSSEQLTGLEDNILILERIEGWQAAICCYADIFINALRLMEEAIQGIELDAKNRENMAALRRLAGEAEDLKTLLYGQKVVNKDWIDIASYPWEGSRLHSAKKLRMNVAPGTRLWLRKFFLENIILNIFRLKDVNEPMYIDMAEENGYTKLRATYKDSRNANEIFAFKTDEKDRWFRGPLLLDLIEAVDGEVKTQNVGGNIEMTVKFPLPAEQTAISRLPSTNGLVLEKTALATKQTGLRVAKSGEILPKNPLGLGGTQFRRLKQSPDATQGDDESQNNKSLRSAQHLMAVLKDIFERLYSSEFRGRRVAFDKIVEMEKFVFEEGQINDAVVTRALVLLFHGGILKRFGDSSTADYSSATLDPDIIAALRQELGALGLGPAPDDIKKAVKQAGKKVLGNWTIVSHLTTVKKAELILDYGLYGGIDDVDGYLCDENGVSPTPECWRSWKTFIEVGAALNKDSSGLVVLAFKIPDDFVLHYGSYDRLTEKAKVDSLTDGLIKQLNSGALQDSWGNNFLQKMDFFIKHKSLARIAPDLLDVERTIQYNVNISGEGFLKTPIGKRLINMRDNRTSKGSCADCLNTITDNSELFNLALTEGFNVDKDLLPLRRNKHNEPFSDTTVNDREIWTLLDLGILLALPDGTIKFSNMMVKPGNKGPPDKGYTKKLVRKIIEIEYLIGKKGPSKNKPFHRGEISSEKRPEIKKVVMKVVQQHRASQWMAEDPNKIFMVKMVRCIMIEKGNPLYLPGVYRFNYLVDCQGAEGRIDYSEGFARDYMMTVGREYPACLIGWEETVAFSKPLFSIQKASNLIMERLRAGTEGAKIGKRPQIVITGVKMDENGKFEGFYAKLIEPTKIDMDGTEISIDTIDTERLIPLQFIPLELQQEIFNGDPQRYIYIEANIDLVITSNEGKEQITYSLLNPIEERRKKQLGELREALSSGKWLTVRIPSQTILRSESGELSGLAFSYKDQGFVIGFIDKKETTDEIRELFMAGDEKGLNKLLDKEYWVRVLTIPDEGMATFSMRPAAKSFVTPIALAQDEAKRIHDENLKLIPDIPEKTILCHIIADSILAIKQRPILQDLEKEMAGSNYREKVVQLKISNSSDFVEELRKVMANKTKKYEGYKIQFDVACPNTEFVKAVLNSGLGVKALAFKPCKEVGIDVAQGEGVMIEMAQVEGIILALRALNSGEIENLREAFKFLAGKDLSQEESAEIKTIDDFIKRITFTLPVTRVDYNKIKEVNDLIRKNIEQAA